MHAPIRGGGIGAMDQKTRTRISKSLSFVLRHRPESIDVRLDRHGWAEIALPSDTAALRAAGIAILRKPFTPEQLGSAIEALVDRDSAGRRDQGVDGGGAAG